MNKFTRKDLKTDRFAQEVTHSLEYVQDHRKQAVRYGVAGLVAVLLIASGWSFFKNRTATRQADLTSALRNKEGIVAAVPTPGDPRQTFPTQEAKDKVVQKGLDEVVAKHSGSNEAAVAHYHLGILYADKGKLDDAARQLQSSISSGNADTASVAKLSLVQVLHAQGKFAEAEKLCRELMDRPTALVSKEQAIFMLARVLAATKPADARKLIEPLMKDERVAVARNASALIAEIPTQ